MTNTQRANKMLWIADDRASSCASGSTSPGDTPATFTSHSGSRVSLPDRIATASVTKVCAGSRNRYGSLPSIDTS